jgi:hypothetical protein
MMKLLGAGILLPEFFSQTKNVWGAATSEKTCYALTIGIDKVDPGAYGGWDGKLGGCENDCDLYQSIVAPFATKVRPLKTGEARRDNVRRHIAWAANNLKQGDLFIVTYAGHGGQLDDRSIDEGDGRDETWCLYDGQMPDDELFNLWSLFREGVRILIISDSCHSGTVARAAAAARSLSAELETDTPFSRTLREIDTSSASQPRARGEKPRDQAATLRALKELGQLGRPATGTRSPGVERDVAHTLREHPEEGDLLSLFRGMPEGFVQGADEALGEYYDQLARLLPGDSRSGSAMQASGLLLAGCQDSQFSMESGGHGVFTWTFKQTYKPNTTATEFASYEALLNAIVKKMPPSQRPNFFPFGRRDDQFYYEQPPFQV